MADEFDQFLAAALAPAERLPDRRFVARVEARIAIEDHLFAERRTVARRLLVQLVALLAVAAAALWLARAAAVAQLFADSPAFVLTGLLSGFALLVLLFSQQADEANGRKMEIRTISNS